MEEREHNYALYISVGAALFVVLLVSIWLYRSVKTASTEKNDDPLRGYVCIENSCSVKKKCDNSTLVIYTTPPNRTKPTQQRIPNSIECRQG